MTICAWQYFGARDFLLLADAHGAAFAVSGPLFLWRVFALRVCCRPFRRVVAGFGAVLSPAPFGVSFGVFGVGGVCVLEVDAC